MVGFNTLKTDETKLVLQRAVNEGMLFGDGKIAEPATSKTKPHGRYLTENEPEVTNDHVIPGLHMFSIF